MNLRSFKQNNCFVQLFAFATLFFIARGIPFDQTFKITAYIAIQIFVGGEIWTRLVKNHSIGTLEYFGAGFALGSALFTIIDQLVIAIGLPVHDFVLPFLIFTDDRSLHLSWPERTLLWLIVGRPITYGPVAHSPASVANPPKTSVPFILRNFWFNIHLSIY